MLKFLFNNGDADDVAIGAKCVDGARLAMVHNRFGHYFKIGGILNNYQHIARSRITSSQELGIIPAENEVEFRLGVRIVPAENEVGFQLGAIRA